MRLLNALLFCLALFFILPLTAHSQEDQYYKITEKANPFPTMWASLPDSTRIECVELSWPWDDRLCDAYAEAAGEGTYRMYKTPNGKVLKEEVYDSYCQGDSESGYVRYFAENGQPVYSELGFNMYVEQTISIFENGVPVVTIIQPSEFEEVTQTTYNAPREIPENDSYPLAMDCEKRMNDLLSNISERIKGLQGLLPTLTDESDINEAKQTIDSLERILQKGPDHYFMVLRKPGQKEVETGESVLFTSLKTPIYAAPRLKSEVLFFAPFHAQSTQLLEFGQMETQDDLGTHPWFKVSFWDEILQARQEGWVYGAFVGRDFYPE